MGLPRAKLYQSEKLELDKANYLYLKCIGLADLCYEKQVPFGIEFPGKLEYEHATLADLPAALALLSKPGVKLVDLDQCRFGSWTTKPF